MVDDLPHAPEIAGDVVAAGRPNLYRNEPMDRSHPDGSIWLKTTLVVLLAGSAVAVVHGAAMARVVDRTILSLVLSFLAVQTAAVVLLAVGLVIAKAVTGARERRIRRLTPTIRRRLVDWVIDEDPRGDARDRRALAALQAECPTALERCADDLLAVLSGTERDRLSRILDELGIVAGWERDYATSSVERRRLAVSRLARLTDGRGEGLLRRALDDIEPAVRIEAARGLLRGGASSEVERVFDFATHQPLLVRAVLVEDLRPHATRLGEHAIPRALAASDPRRAMVALEMIEAWQKSVVAPGVLALLRHPRGEVRARAVRALPYAVAGAIVDREAIAALADPDPGVRIAGARLVGRSGLVDGVPALARLLHARGDGVAIGAAFALARLGETGRTALEHEVRQGEGRAALVALEALEALRTERLHLAIA